MLTLWHLPFMFGPLDFRRRNIMASEAPRVWDISTSLLMILSSLVLPYQMVNIFSLVSMIGIPCSYWLISHYRPLHWKIQRCYGGEAPPYYIRPLPVSPYSWFSKMGGLEIVSSKHVGGSITSILRIGGKTTIWQDGQVTVLHRNSKHCRMY